MILDRIAGAARRRVEEKKRIKPLDGNEGGTCMCREP